MRRIPQIGVELMEEHIEQRRRGNERVTAERFDVVRIDDINRMTIKSAIESGL